MPISRAAALRCGGRFQWLLSVLLTLTGLLLSGLLAHRLWLGEQAQRLLQFEHLAQERLSRLEERLLAQQRDLDGMRRFFESSGEVTRDEFERFATPLLGEHLTLVWAPLLEVDPAQREEQLQAFTQSAMRQTDEHFRLREADRAGRLRPLQPRERYFPLLFGLSRSIAEPPLGLDMASPGPRRDALEAALREGSITRSAVLRFAGGAESERTGLLLVAPVYATLAQGVSAQPTLRGALFAAVSLRQLLDPEQTESSEHSLAIEVHDLAHPDLPLLYQHGQAAADSPLQFSRDYHGGLWEYRLVIRPGADFLAEHPTSPVWRLALPGAALSLLLGVLLYVLLSQRRRALALVERRSAELRQSREALRQSEERWSLASDGIGDGVWDWDLLRERVHFSPMWKSMLGYAEEDIGDHPEEWRNRLHPEDAARSQQALHDHLAGRTPMYRCEKRLRRKDGSWQWLLARGRVVERAADGQPLRVIGTHVDISARKALEFELRQSHARLQGLLEAATRVAIISVDLCGRIDTFNAGAERLLGHEREDMFGQPLDPLLDLAQLAACAGLAETPDDAPAALAALLDQRQHRELDTVLRRRNREMLHASLMLSTILEADGRLAGYLLVAIDNGERLRARQALEERSQLLERLGAQVPGTIYQYRLYPDGRSCFPYASAGIREIYEVTPQEVRSDAGPALERLHPQDRQRVITSIAASAEELSRWQQDYRVVLPQRGLRWLHGEAVPERLADGSVLWHGFIADISGLKHVEDELRTLTVTDPLTDIHNRRYFLEQLDAELERRARSDRPLSLIMFDIDRFKRINDGFGHDTGDRVLQELCRRVSARLRRIDSFCRLGGEEFIVICPETGSDQALYLAEELRRLVQDTPFAEVGQVTASFGVSAARSGDSHESLLQRADQAMYAAKDGGRNRVCGETCAVPA